MRLTIELTHAERAKLALLAGRLSAESGDRLSLARTARRLVLERLERTASGGNAEAEPRPAAA